MKRKIRDVKSISHRIESAASEVVGRIENESVEVYVFLKSQYNTTDVATNYVFQFLFRSFFRLDNAGLSLELKSEFFKLFARFQTNGGFDLTEAVLHLYDFPTRQYGNTVQFSFCTKMAHIIDATYPIYDNEVVSVFGLRQPYDGKHKMQDKLDIYLKQLAHIRNSYDEIISEGLLDKTIGAFENRFSSYKIDGYKRLDYLFWSAGKMKLLET